MNKLEFLTRLREGLQSIPEEDRRRTVGYYREMIDDRMEDGLSEEAAVDAVGDVEEIICQVLAETPQVPDVVEEPVQEQPEAPENRTNGSAVLLAATAILWIPLLFAFFGVLVGLWAVVVALYAVAVALCASTLGCVVTGFLVMASPFGMMVSFGAAMVCAGLAILFVLFSNLAAKGMAKLTKLTCKWVKSWFVRKEKAA